MLRSLRSHMAIPIVLCAAIVSHTLAQSDDGWSLLPVPGPWEEAGDRYAGLDGFAWYRCFVKVPKEWEGGRLMIVVGKINDVDETYFNGERVAAHGSLPPLFQRSTSEVRRPAIIEPDQIRFGGYNLIAVRVYNAEGPGGIVAGPFQLIHGEQSIDLTGLWQFHPGDRQSWAQWPREAGPDRIAHRFLSAAGAKAAGVAPPVKLDPAILRKQYDAVTQQFYEGYVHPNARTDDKGQPLPPAKALAALKPADDLALDLVTHEPEVAQPIHVSFDERGRMWVVQYLQFPEPAGLKVLSYDEHLRTIYDKVPPAPPRNIGPFRGKDKITIHEDSDGDGAFETVRTFVDGLNITSSALCGRGGVWVLNPPYLLFYPDKDADGVPDGDPVVHLTGFGLEDTHSVANSLTWGPDGWIYGATGSTCTGRIRTSLDPSRPPVAFFGQTIWRYHPERHEFEIFADGGYNTFGVDFDDKGRVFSGVNAAVRGVHFVQGGYYFKSFGKHGPHTNPYAFIYLDAMPHTDLKPATRLTHQFVIYDGQNLPARYRGKLLAVNSLQSWVIASRLDPSGSTFKSIDEFWPVTSTDRWFRPVQITTGPEGALYISDWYDARITHFDPRDTWDHERGRIYRLRGKDHAAGYPPFDLGKAASDRLVDLLSSPNRWYRDTALRLLGDRQDRSVIPRLRQIVSSQAGDPALGALWTLYQIGGFDESAADSLLVHPDEFVRMWGIRLIGDYRAEPPPPIAGKLLSLAGTDPSVHVLSQLAATSRRIPGDVGLRIVCALTQRGDEVANDPFIPTQLWWAVEDRALSHPRLLTELFNTAQAWQRPVVRKTIMPLLARRYATDATPENQRLLAALLDGVPTGADRIALLDAVNTAYEGRPTDPPEPELARAVRAGGEDPAHAPAPQLAMLLRLRDPAARAYALDAAGGKAPADEPRRAQLLRLLGQTGVSDAAPIALNILATDTAPTLRSAAIECLAHSGDPATAHSLARLLPLIKEPPLRASAIGLLLSRRSTAPVLLEAVIAGVVKQSEVPAEKVRLLRHTDTSLDALIDRALGKEIRPSSAQKLAQVQRIAALLGAAPGDPLAGKTWFTALCARCHTLHGEGAKVGPDLTAVNRNDLPALLQSIVDPSAAIHEDFTAYHLRTSDGRDLAGLITERQGGHIKLTDAAGAVSVIPTSQIASEEALATSLMPEGLLAPLSDQQVRDLMAYVRSDRSPR